MKQVILFQVVILLVVVTGSVSAQAVSGGPLSPEQAAYDVSYYNLDLAIDPGTLTITGSLLCQAEIVDPIHAFVLDLQSVFSVSSVLYKKNGGAFASVSYTHVQGRLSISLPEQATAGDLVSVQVFYGGAPRIATNPPWGDGFVWAETPGGEPWIGVACESSGADIWWPCKDHPSDEPDSMSISFTVPNPLVCVSNGQYKGSMDNGDNTSTFSWFVSTPINNYNVTIYAAEYLLIEDDYPSTIGHTIPFYFWVLPEHYDTALNIMDVWQTEFDFFESTCGPFPFGSDKHGFAEAPYWGMEHQTIIAYGHDYTVSYWGYDYIHYHELAHEWWGNLVTAKDFADIWIHEGIATYMQALYIEDLNGMDMYKGYMNHIRPLNDHSYALAPREALTASQAFDNLNPYYRGASVMQSLRYHLGDDAFFSLLKRWAYPDPEDLDNTRGRLCRIVSTDDLKEQAEDETGVDLDPFFEVFFREAAYPVLDVQRKADTTLFVWETEGGIGLDLDIPVLVNGAEQKVEMIDGSGMLAISSDDVLVIDPDKWILMDTAIVTAVAAYDIAQSMNYGLEQNYPNPFHLTSTIGFTLPESQYVTLKVYDSLGKEITTLISEELLRGKHQVHLNGTQLSRGIYFYTLKAGSFIETLSFIVK
jgi:aminopeptidase N